MGRYSMTFKGFIGWLKSAKEALLLIIFFLSVGFVVGVNASLYRGMPSRVLSLEQRATNLERSFAELSRNVADIRKSISVQLCLSVAEKTGEPWQSCIDGKGELKWLR